MIKSWVLIAKNNTIATYEVVLFLNLVINQKLSIKDTCRVAHQNNKKIKKNKIQSKIWRLKNRHNNLITIVWEKMKIQ